MDANAKIKLTKKWWEDNKATTLKDAAKFGDAIDAYLKVSKKYAVANGIERVKGLALIDKALAELEDARDKTSKACGKLHGDTKKVLDKQYKDAIAKEQAEWTKARKDFDKTVKALKIDDFFKDATWLVAFQQYAKKVFIDESAEFLLECAYGKKRGKKQYATFVAERSPKEINISYDLRQRFVQEINDEGKPSNDAWDAAIKEIKSVLKSGNHFGLGFRQWLWDQA
ncbi:MAG: hypothetical protein H6732_04650 [Alphaproteobacteria bacterium]|nr:hypothetical protein [Alphaproteobacteria bacterium]